MGGRYSVIVRCSQYLAGATSATIKVYRVADNSEVALTSDVCYESGTDMFCWLTSSMADQPTGRTEYYYTMTPNIGAAKQGKFTLRTYCDHISLERMLRAVNRSIHIGPVSPIKQSVIAQGDIEQDELTEFLRDADAYIDARLSRCYELPLSLRNMRTERLLMTLGCWLGGYFVYEALYPHGSAGELPSVVKEWMIRADKVLADLAAGRLILEGERPLISSAGRTLPKYGKPETIYKSYGCPTVDSVFDDDDIGDSP